MPDIDTTAISGVEARGYRRGALTTDGWDQYVIPVRDRIVSYQGRAATFRIAGIAGTTGHKLLSIHNATGSTVVVEIQKIFIDTMSTAAKVVAPAIARLHRVTVLPTGGTACPKVPVDSSLTSNASVTVLQAASSETVASTITATIPASSILTQQHLPRALTLVGYEMSDRIEMCEDDPITLRALEGIVLNLDYSVATASATTDVYIAGVYWEEYTRP